MGEGPVLGEPSGRGSGGGAPAEYNDFPLITMSNHTDPTGAWARSPRTPDDDGGLCRRERDPSHVEVSMA